jgi:hypothetical protein
MLAEYPFAVGRATQRNVTHDEKSIPIADGARNPRATVVTVAESSFRIVPGQWLSVNSALSLLPNRLR